MERLTHGTSRRMSSTSQAWYGQEELPAHRSFAGVDEAVEVPRNGDRSRGALRPAATLPGSRGRGMCDRRLDGRARIALGRGQAQNPSAHFRELRTQSGGSLNSIKSLHQGLSFPCQGRMIRRWPASVPRAWWIIALSTPAVGTIAARGRRYRKATLVRDYIFL